MLLLLQVCSILIFELMPRLAESLNSSLMRSKYLQDLKNTVLWYLNPHYLWMSPQFCSPQSLELGRAHKKASSIVNATIDPDKVILLFNCGYVMNSCFSRYLHNSNRFLLFRTSTQFPREGWRTPMLTKDSSISFQLLTSWRTMVWKRQQQR